MPPKKANSTSSPTRKSSRATSKPEPALATNGIKKTVKAPATKAKAAPKSSTTSATKQTKKTTIKGAPVKAATKEPAKKSNKRKADDDVEDEPKVNGNKRARTDSGSASDAPQARPKAKAVTAKRKAPAVKAPAEKKQKPKNIINEAPQDVLNVYVFGDGTNGELGLGTGKNCAEVKRPRLNPHLDAAKVGVVALAVGGMHTAVLTKDNKIFTWGVNDQGALGRDTAWDGGLRDMDDDNSDSDSDSDTGASLNPKESTPTEIELSGVPEGTVWTRIAASDSATFALTDDGLIYGCGTFRSNEGIFGFFQSTLIQRTFTLIPDLKNITQIVTGENHVLALDNKGCVYAWGSGQQNQLGRRVTEREPTRSLTPRTFGLPKQIVAVGSGSYHAFAIHKNGTVYSWGLNSFGETGNTRNFDAEGESDAHQPVVITSLDAFGKVIQIAGGSHHTLALTEKGEVLVWGRLDGYQLGLELSKIPKENVIMDAHDQPRILKVPMQVPNINGAFVAAGSDHSIAIAKDGKAYSWGFSTSYQTGLGTDEETEVATLIDNTAVRGKQLVWAGAGGQFSVVAGLDGKEAPLVNGHA